MLNTRAHEPIAIIGLGCRFPKAANPEALWQLLIDGCDAITEIPASRFPVDAFYDARPAIPGRIMTRWGGFLDGIELFDAGFFGMSPREAERLDPQQRLLLETTWEALESAGQVPGQLRGSETAVFVGMWLNEYENRMFRDPGRIDFYMTTGTGRYTASGRISHIFGWHGPSVTIDSACSSSLVAVHLACASLRVGECDMAVAGGANVLIEPSITLAYSQSRMMSPDGRCKFGDARANGYVRSDGAGVVVLKRLSRALADGDSIEALILGSAVNNDGDSSGSLGTPARAGQEDLLRKACLDAGVEPSDVDYVEAHGTGTKAGDPVEIQALAAVLGEGRPARQPLAIGSIKTNIGHTESAAGVAGLMKATLALKHRTIPRNLHLQTLNPDIPWDRLPVEIPRESRQWPETGRAGIAGVSAFGIAGTNAHLVLQRYDAADTISGPEMMLAARAHVVPLSAHSPEALRDLARRWEAWANEPGQSAVSLADVAATAALRRHHHDHRLAVVADSREVLIERLRAFVQGEPSRGIPSGQRDPDGRPRVVFVCPGQGAQWLGMGTQLLAQEPVFRAALEHCDAAIRTEANWSLLDVLAAGPGAAWLEDIALIQPTLFAIEVALADLWRSWGIEPSAVVGHSMGEAAAACIAGALTLEDAVQVICRRSLLMKRVSGRGGMAVVGLTLDDARAVVAAYDGRVSVAVSNSVQSTVLSGEPQALDAILATLEGQGVFCRRIKVDVASHSPQMDPIRGELVTALASLVPHGTTVPMWSTVTGTAVGGTELDANYWGRNLREPVLFSTVVERLAREGHRVFLELSPHPLLVPAVQQQLSERGLVGTAWPSFHREEDERFALLETLGGLYAAGCEPAWERVVPTGRSRVALPSYPWQRERHWYEEKGCVSAAMTSRHGLGRRIEMADMPGTFVWGAGYNRQSHEAMWEHRVGGVATLAAAASLRLVLAAAVEVFGAGDAWRLDQVDFLGAIMLGEEDESTALQIVLRREDECSAGFRLYVRDGVTWTTRVRGRVSKTPGDQAWSSSEDMDLVGLHNGCAPITSGVDAYGALAQAGVAIGFPLQVVDSVRQERGDVLAHLRVPDGGDTMAALLDGGFHLASMAAPVFALAEQSELFMPIHVERIAVCATPTTEAWARARRRETALDTSEHVQEVTVRDGSGARVAELGGIHVRSVARGCEADQALYEVVWERQEDGPASRVTSGATTQVGRWLLFADERGIGEALAEIICRQGGKAVLVERADGWREDGGQRFGIRAGAADDVARLFASCARTGGQEWRAVVYLWGVDHEEAAVGAIEPLDPGRFDAAESLLPILQQLTCMGSTPAPSLWLITSGAQRVTAGDTVGAVRSAALWGMGRVIAVEQPELWGGAVDIDVVSPGNAAELLWREFRAASTEDQVAWRAGVRYVPRLARSATSDMARVCRLRADATYVVTGGLGALGFEVAQWMVSRGARRFLLLGRTELPPRAEWANPPDAALAERIGRVRTLESLGASVHVVSIDVADRKALRACLEQFAGEGWPAIRGVVHAAGVTRDQLMVNADAVSWRDVLRPKALGAWCLHEALEGTPIDFFVLFSSLGSLLGQVGQGSYAAANAVLDALAHHRRASGRAALSVSWGPWGARGFATTAGGAETVRQLAQQGIGTLQSAQALEALGLAMERDTAHVLVAPIDWSRFKESLPIGRRAPLVSSLVGAACAACQGTQPVSGQRTSFRVQLEGLPATERRTRLEEHVKLQLAQVLKLAPSRIDSRKPLGALGVTSILGVEVRTRLERSLAVALPATLIWNYPTLTKLVDHLLVRLGLGSESAETEVRAAAPATDVTINLDTLSDVDALRALRGLQRKTE